MQILPTGWLTEVTHRHSPHQDGRPNDELPSLLVIHNISLPPNQFATPYIDQLFMGQLAVADHPYFADIGHLRVSAHCLIRRDGQIIQYVSFLQRAWHAGISQFAGRSQCNDYSIGIELEGTDDLPYTDSQYQQLIAISKLLLHRYPIEVTRIVGHQDIAPARKTDPGPAFDWPRYRQALLTVGQQTEQDKL